MRTLFYNAQFFTGTGLVNGKALITEDGRIVEFADQDSLSADALRIDCGGGLVTAGLIDLQIAGGGGYLFSSHPDPEALARLTEAIVATGTTGFLLALPTNSEEVYRAAFATVAGWAHPAVMGLHMEGPFISHSRRGAHHPELIREASSVNVNTLLAAASGTIRMMTVAPEVCPPEAIRILMEHGITVAAGHSNASFAEAMAGFEAGIATTTHLFNAMSPLHHRDPGLPGAVFLSDTACASIIADGIHVDYHMVAIAKGIMKERLFLVSDAVEINDRGAYRHVKQDDRFTLPDGTLSGAKLTMLEAVKNCISHAGIEKYEAIRMATLYPASLIGETGRGVIAPGARADLVILDDVMRLKGVCFNGVTELKN
jgi:N-acetylglucosamine-6-phosphate deacetylase